MASPSYPDDASPDTAERPKPLSEESPLLPHGKHTDIHASGELLAALSVTLTLILLSVVVFSCWGTGLVVRVVGGLWGVHDILRGDRGHVFLWRVHSADRYRHPCHAPSVFPAPHRCYVPRIYIFISVGEEFGVGRGDVSWVG